MSAPLHIPWLGGATGWLSPEPLGPAELRGSVVPGKGGHFAAWEDPELFSTEIRAAFRELR